MRLVFDLRHVPDEGKGAGVTHASLELADALESHAKEFGIETVRLNRPKRAWAFRRAILNAKADAVLVLSGSVPPFLPVPAYPWVHDVAIFRHPEWFPQNILKRWLTTTLFLRGVQRAPHVFAVSEDTKKGLMRVARIPADRITVTSQAVSVGATRALPLHKIDKPYAIIIGTIEPRKNIPFIIDLWEEVRNHSGLDARLVLVGKTGWGNVPIPAKTWIDHVQNADDEMRDQLIAGANVLLMPSLYEGFGRMALEAMTLGVPVIASNRGAIPEVVGDAGLLLDPTDREAWIANIVRGLNGELDGTRGPAQASRFSWDRIARLILAKIAEDW